MKALNALLEMLPRYRRRAARRAPGRRPQAATLPSADGAGTDADADDAPRGCGWFDSSHELQRGLRVHEDLSAEALAREMPLANWLDLQLSGWRHGDAATLPM